MSKIGLLLVASLSMAVTTPIGFGGLGGSKGGKSKGGVEDMGGTLGVGMMGGAANPLGSDIATPLGGMGDALPPNSAAEQLGALGGGLGDSDGVMKKITFGQAPGIGGAKGGLPMSPGSIGGMVPTDMGAMVPGDVGGMVPTDIGGMVPTDVGGMVPTDVGGMVPTDVGGMVPMDVGGMVPTDVGSMAPGGVANLPDMGMVAGVQDQEANMGGIMNGGMAESVPAMGMGGLGQMQRMRAEIPEEHSATFDGAAISETMNLNTPESDPMGFEMIEGNKDKHADEMLGQMRVENTVIVIDETMGEEIAFADDGAGGFIILEEMDAEGGRGLSTNLEPPNEESFWNLPGIMDPREISDSDMNARIKTVKNIKKYANHGMSMDK